MWRPLFDFLKATAVFGVIWDSCVFVARVEGISMQPTLNPDPLKSDFVLLSAVGSQKISCGDIVCSRSMKNPKERTVKRVTALEGDEVNWPRYGKITVPMGHIWLEGDSNNSMDSNHYGPVPRAMVEAKVVSIIWPPSRIQMLKKDFVRTERRQYW